MAKACRSNKQRSSCSCSLLIKLCCWFVQLRLLQGRDDSTLQDSSRDSFTPRKFIAHMVLLHRIPRQQDGVTTTSLDDIRGVTKASDESSGERLLSVLANYWYVLLVLVVVIVVGCVFTCTCILRKKRHRTTSRRLEMRNHSYSVSPESNHSSRPRTSKTVPQHTNSSRVDLANRSPSVNHTPIPSPQPSFASSQRSVRSSHRGSGRKRLRNHSPGHMSSGSEDTIRPSEGASMCSSLTSSVSTLAPGSTCRTTVYKTEGPTEKAGRSHRELRRTTSNPLVKVTPMGVCDNSSLRSAPSTTSMLSVGSIQSSRSNRSNRSQAIVQVDVKVHLSSEQEREARSEVAAALAESARQLAQSAANFGQEEDSYQWHPQRSHSQLSSPRSSVSTSHSLPSSTSRRQLFSSHSSSYLPREYGSRPTSPYLVPTAILDRPQNTASLDQPNHSGHFERSRRNSVSSYRSRHSQSPLTVKQHRIGVSGQKLIGLNPEYSPSNMQHYMSKPPLHVRPKGSDLLETSLDLLPHLQQSRVSLDNLRNGYAIQDNRSRHLHRTISAPSGVTPVPVASLDFQTHNSKPAKSSSARPYPMNGLVYSHNNIHPNLNAKEDTCLQLDPDLTLGIGNGYGTGTDSNVSTLRGSSHSDNKDRLSRLSEQSEHNETESEGTCQEDHAHSQQKVVPNNRNYKEPHNGGGIMAVAHSGLEPGQNFTLPNHYSRPSDRRDGVEAATDSDQLLSPASSTDMAPPVSPSKRKSPSRKNKTETQGVSTATSDPNLHDCVADSVSTTSTLPQSPPSSVCLSSQSCQSINEDDTSLPQSGCILSMGDEATLGCAESHNMAIGSGRNTQFGNKMDSVPLNSSKLGVDYEDNYHRNEYHHHGNRSDGHAISKQLFNERQANYPHSITGGFNHIDHNSQFINPLSSARQSLVTNRDSGHETVTIDV